MALLEGSVPALLDDIGAELDDLDLAYGTDSRLKQDRACRALTAAQRKVWAALRDDGVDAMHFKQVLALTVDSADSERYELTARCRQIILLKDDNTEYEPLDTYQTAHSGYVVEEGCRAIRLRNIDSISGTLTAWVVNEPARLSCGVLGGQTGVATTAVKLPASPTLGAYVIQNSYYNGARIGVATGTGAGQIRTCTAHVGSTRALTVAAWDTAPTAASVYSVMLDVPEAAKQAVVLRAAVMLVRADGVMAEGENRQDLYRDAGAAYIAARDILLNTNLPLVHTPRVVWNPGGGGGEFT